MLFDRKALIPTPDTLKPVEADLMARLAANRLFWCGRGATALYFAYRLIHRAAGKTRGEVIVPAISCPTLAATALMAGLTPRFADCDPETGMMSETSLNERLSEETRAVVFIHLYGQTVDLSGLRKICDQRGIFLIEDMVQALGGCTPGGQQAGSQGHMAVMSFSRTKILECGGGCLALRHEVLERALEEEARCFEPVEPLPPEAARILAISSRNLHHALVGFMRLDNVEQVAAEFLKWRPFFDRLYVEPMTNPDTVAATWAGLQSSLSRRLEKAALYERLLEGGPWKLLRGWSQSGVSWRYSLLTDFPESLVRLSEAVRGDGYHVSNLYWPVQRFFRPEDACPKADSFGRRIINLWVDDSVSEKDVEGCAGSLLKHCSDS